MELLRDQADDMRDRVAQTKVANDFEVRKLALEERRVAMQEVSSINATKINHCSQSHD